MNSVVLITGVAGGIGKATAQLFHDAGWKVWGVDVKGGDAPSGVDHYVQADVSKVEDVEHIVSSLNERVGRLDALVNNAAIQITKPLVETEPKEWDHLMDVNVRAAYLLVRQSHSLLKEGGASIVNVSSVHAVATSAEIAAYATSKGALQAFSRALSIELASDDIRVNAVLPGAVDTHMLRAGLERGHAEDGSMEDRLQAFGRKHVIGRIGQPEEIAETILFLADEARSSFITGQSLIVDGGATARLSTE